MGRQDAMHRLAILLLALALAAGLAAASNDLSFMFDDHVVTEVVTADIDSLPPEDVAVEEGDFEPRAAFSKTQVSAAAPSPSLARRRKLPPLWVFHANEGFLKF